MGSINDDETISLQHCRSGSREAFGDIVRRYMKDAYFIAFGLVGNREDALDLSQEAFIRAYRHINHLKPSSRFFPWFYQILRNLCFTHLKKRKKAQVIYNNDCLKEEDSGYNHRTFTPEMISERNESNERLWKAISKLDEKHREVIILRHFQNMSYEQISQALFCNKGTVTSRLYYARRRLKDILDSEKGGRQE